ncbi:MAG: UDP-N-acetylmuramoyl-L-alanyl-D-glutamate--2,6-diaminopimelate ligase [Acidimicrobiaceae bacterium]|nr:UDP-N-acetylmuramoyl-L-alanyl-D-glutamate--2,6-diaminopimelate ligase [Acidimicrobiaceae bacterium]
MLSDVARGLSGVQLIGDVEIRGITFDSRAVHPGDVFLAYCGEHRDGHLYAGEAVQRGATAIVVERVLDLAVAQCVVPSVSEAAGHIASKFYDHPSRSMSVVGVTGTNGKTTTCQLLRACLGTEDQPAAQIGTTGSFLGDELIMHPSLSTPEAPTLQSLFDQLRLRGTRRVAMEVTSHGLDRHRVSGTHFNVGVFLNLSPEHLDYHGSMQEYFVAKRRMFEQEHCDAAIICVDDEWGRKLAGLCSIPVITFGRHESADVKMSTQGMGLDGLLVRLAGPEGTTEISSRLIGEINGCNVAAAFLAARLLGVEASRAAHAIAECVPPPGRFEVITRDEPYLSVADYAHTPNALEALIATAREVSEGEVHLVLGARGQRYSAKRPEMARIATQADHIRLTTDSPCDEDPMEIINQMLSGVPPMRRDRVSVELDRATAIRHSVRDMKPGDILLITGRGPEGTQRFGEEEVVLDDRVVARLALDARNEAIGDSDPMGVSVVVVASNAAETLAATLRSVVEQTVKVHEIVVVDDGSTDDTVEVALSFAPLVRVVRQPRFGFGAARNVGVAQSSSRWVAFLEAGHLWHRKKLELQLSVLQNSDAVLCASDWSGEDHDDRREVDVQLMVSTDVGGESIFEQIHSCTVLVRRDVYGRTGGFEQLVESDEANVWRRLSTLGPVRKIKQPLTFCVTPDRDFEQQPSGENSPRRSDDDSQAVTSVT